MFVQNQRIKCTVLPTVDVTSPLATNTACKECYCSGVKQYIKEVLRELKNNIIERRKS